MQGKPLIYDLVNGYVFILGAMFAMLSFLSGVYNCKTLWSTNKHTIQTIKKSQNISTADIKSMAKCQSSKHTKKEKEKLKYLWESKLNLLN